MTTATKPKPSPLAKVEQAEREWAAARDRASQSSREHGERIRQHQALADQRRQLIHRDPELVDHLNVPVDEDNAVGQIDVEIAQLGDLGESAKVDHHRAMEQSKRQSFEAQVRNHANAMRQSEYTKDDALRASFAEAAAKAADIADQRVGVRRRLMEIGHVCREDSRGIPLEATVNEARTARAMADSPSALPVQATEDQ